jgi:uncharacterized protein
MVEAYCDLPFDLFVDIALYGGARIYYALCLTCRDIRDQLMRPSVRALAMNTFAKKNIRIQGDGIRIEEFILPNGLRHGEACLYNNDRLVVHLNWQIGKKHGREYHWYESGVQHLSRNWVDDLLEGEVFQWAEDGKLLNFACFKHGHLSGTAVKWYKNGNYRKMASFVDDHPKDMDLSCDWHPNGMLSSSILWINGGLEGLVSSYNDDGSLDYICYYHNNKLCGLFETWYPNGMLKTRGYFVDGKRHGLSECWWDNGNLKGRARYEQDVLIEGSLQEWNRDGTPA